ncbi:DUF4832 domain-containing protein [Nonomuraea mesophila]|uniref:DUF4832 domain-containing protein n=1 Tax=Nonomuraea mesophila TaxID=2530382 RepID=A0A4R5FUW7_9ACTN|nr:DUF4832 domain-containing protein [Nonomuraea mesophila]TDE57999.1 DUF4832 domain-containing protein [Nonomuraea mesophila]
MVKRILALIVLLCAPLAVAPAHASAAAGGDRGTVTYARTSAAFVNPERGLYHHSGDCDKDDFSVETLRGYRADDHISLVMCVFYLAEFKDGPISPAALAQLHQQLGTVRQAGLKAILRFAYTTSTDGDDAPKERVLAHLDQLAPYLRANEDVIYLMQAGFVGAWGEWYYTRNFGDQGVVTDADWAKRKAVVDKILAVLPSTRMAQLRTPLFKRTMYSAGPLPPGQAHDGSAPARLGHHNDCFLASPDDYGTYADPAVEYPYLRAETAFVAMGGETCNPNPPRSDCPTAKEELAGFHYSYLNTDYHPGVLGGWAAGGCLDEISRRLGYRFALRSGAYPDRAARGGVLPVAFTVRNDGYASPVNPRDAALVLRDTATSAVHRFPLATDPRTWQAGETTTIRERIRLPGSLPRGRYELLLDLPDPKLPGRAEYSIRLANEGTWEPGTGLNALLHTVTVT